ncbi:MAG TPA: copper chaperone PCu(A)C [Gammaproteobacteria bacterium]|nr:copper chaperone PCu(A)C [Gammaproteobacteria bacterium]
MNHPSIMRLAVLLAFLVARPVLAGGDVVAHAPWIEEGPPNTSVLAGYVDMENTSNTPRRLVAVKSPLVDEIMIHVTEVKNGVASMRHVDGLDLPAKGHIVFKPGGYHLMLMGVHGPLKAGDQVPLEFEFANGEQMRVNAEVRKSGSASPR